MSKIASISLFVTALSLLMLPSAEVSAQEASCSPCRIAHESCSANCSGLDGKEERVACRIGCENAAATCSCAEERVILTAEDAAARLGLWMNLEAAACHSTTPCPSEYGSCTLWSAYTACGDPFCGLSAACSEECPEWPCPIGGIAMKQWRERYRICFNAQQQACTEYQRSVSSGSCGCE